MALQSQNFISAANTDITVAGNTVYIVPAATKTTLFGVSVANRSANVITANVWISRSSVNYTIGNNVTIFPGSAFVPIGEEQKMTLLAADAIKVSASVAGSVDAILSGVEFA